MNKLNTKIFIDGGDAQETAKAKELLGYLDGQTTNPSLIAKRLGAKTKLTQETALEEYKRIVQEMSRIIPDGSVSIQVFANEETKAEEMLAQARERIKWIPNASIKIPCIKEGLEAAAVACKEMPLNITLAFSQSQAAAVFEATKEARYPVFISPFVGRLDDQGEAGMDVIQNIIKMYREQGDKHVEVLTASIRNFDHVLYGLKLGSDILTIPFEIFKQWADQSFPQPASDYQYDTGGRKRIPYNNSVALGKPWQEYDLSHPLTTKGVQRFRDDWMGLFTNNV